MKTCSKCGEEKPAIEFHADKSKKDGLCSCCKTCNAASGAASRAARKKAYADTIIPAAKVCPMCDKDKPASEFHSNRARKDGLETYCKACRAARAAAYRKANFNVVFPEKKVCPRCGEEKPASEFYSDKSKRGGLSSHCKACVSVHNAEHYAANKNKLLAQNKAYREANKKKLAAKSAIYRATHKEEIAARSAKWRAKNKEWLTTQKAEYYAANRERLLARQVKWYESNSKRAIANAHAYEARKKNALGTHTAEDIQVQYDAQKGRCLYCDARVGDDYHVDHVVPLSEGGSNWPSNLVIACEHCNKSKNAKNPMDFAGILF